MHHLSFASMLSTCFLLTGCGGDSGPDLVDPPPTPPSILARGVSALDVGNALDGADIQVTLITARDAGEVSEYRIVLELGAGTLTATTALALGPDRYVEVASAGDTVITRLPGIRDAAGGAVEEGVAYAVRVLSVASDPDVASQLTDPVAITLENEPAVLTFAPRIVGGTGGIAIAPDGAVYMADFVSRVYRVAPDGTQTLFSSGHAVPSGNTVLDDGALLQANFSDGTIDRVGTDGVRSTFATGLQGPVGMVPTSAGALLVVNCNANTVSRVDAGVVSQFSASPRYRCPNSITTDGADTFYVVNFNDGAVLAVDDEGGVSTIATLPGGGNGHIVHQDGALWVTDKSGRRIYRVGLDGAVDRIAGSGAYGASDGSALEATLARPNGIVFSPDGRFLYWNDHLGDAVNAYAQGPSVLRRFEFPRP